MAVCGTGTTKQPFSAVKKVQTPFSKSKKGTTKQPFSTVAERAILQVQQNSHSLFCCLSTEK
jgi:hypothetical protein